ncbi:MAG: sigma-54 interaction domain-containing protein [Candidatus Binatia bacterium]
MTKVLRSVTHSGDDFLSCPFTETDLFLRVQRLLRWNGQTDTSSRAKAIKEKLHLDSIVGESECLLGVIEKIPLLARANAAVVIHGETGTGKELFARAIHYQGLRSGKPFIPVNCGALPDELFENELFGHMKGAYTNAFSAEKGLIAEAEGGTLFLDEVDALTPSAQIKLLRFLQDGEYRPLGYSRPLVANVRVIAATNTNLKHRVELGRFREDLFYRLNVLSLSIPPLRDRINDIPQLAAHFLLLHGRQPGRDRLRVSVGAQQKLMTYSWPGNVRELEAVIQRAGVISPAEVLQPQDIDLPSNQSKETDARDSLRKAKSFAIGEFERRYLSNLLAFHRGNISHAAKAAGKDRRTFQRLLQKYSLDRRSFEV